MADSVDFFIDDKVYTTYKASQSVEDILSFANLSADQYILVSPRGDEYRDAKQTVEIHSGDRFTTKKRDRDAKPGIPVEISYRVNGEPQVTKIAELTVQQILRAAGKPASIDLQQLSSYILENIKTGEKYESLEDSVHILNNDEFLAVHSGATPVAYLQPH